MSFGEDAVAAAVAAVVAIVAAAVAAAVAAVVAIVAAAVAAAIAVASSSHGLVLLPHLERLSDGEGHCREDVGWLAHHSTRGGRTANHRRRHGGLEKEYFYRWTCKF